ncbi:probable E3 ubiquitin-protein ligase ARI5, partial [Durio zibethinus]|uniref:RBR-type E3 ubiquitin transferase n=1 Tax=Durio zibethinus TaxID=66656 RepID=A0A6P5Z670_DURZI
TYGGFYCRSFNNSFITQVRDAWFSDEFRVQKKLGLVLEKQEIHFPDELTCAICFESYSRDDRSCGKCGHPFCNDCWTNYIRNYIREGTGPLMIRCPEPSCRAALHQELFDKIATEEQMDRFLSYLIKSFVENQRTIKWCPANGCEFAIDLLDGVNSCDVSCLCSYNFCWNCKEEAHRPMGCDIITKWNENINPDTRTMSRIMMCSKPCTKCKRPIEMSFGCMHMKCRPPCNFEFCWICLQRWDGHRNFYGCNRYGEVTAEREKSKESRKKYLHCCDRWEAHGISRRKAVKDLENLKSQQIKKLCDIQQLSC